MLPTHASQQSRDLISTVVLSKLIRELYPNYTLRLYSSSKALLLFLYLGPRHLDTH